MINVETKTKSRKLPARHEMGERKTKMFFLICKTENFQTEPCVKASQGNAAADRGDDSDPDDDSGSGAVLQASAQARGLEVGERAEEGSLSVDPEPDRGKDQLLPPSYTLCLHTWSAFTCTVVTWSL